MFCVLQDIHNEMAQHMSNAAAGAGGLARAQAYERGNDFMRAVDTYLSLTPADVDNLEMLQQCWEQVRRMRAIETRQPGEGVQCDLVIVLCDICPCTSRRRVWICQCTVSKPAADL